MNTMTFTILLLIGPTGDVDSFFGDLNRRPPGAVAVDLRAASQLPTEAFDQVAPSVLRVLRDARPVALRALAMEVYASTCGPGRVGDLISYINERLDVIDSDSQQGQRQWYESHMIVRVYVRSDPAKWSPAFRSSAATRVLLRRIAGFRPHRLDYSINGLALDTLLMLLPNDDSRREVVLDLIREEAVAVWVDNFDPLLLDNEPSIIALRGIARRSGFNHVALRVLSYLGDAETLAILSEKRTAAVEGGEGSTVSVCDEYSKRITLQHPPSKLIDYLQQNDDRSRFQVFAIQRALELGLDQSSIQNALLFWREHSGASTWELVWMERVGTKLGLLNQTGQPTSAPASNARQVLYCNGLARRHEPIIVPDRRPKRLIWIPSEENWEPFSDWFLAQDWENVSESDALARLFNKLCEMNLRDPELCQTPTTTPVP